MISFADALKSMYGQPKPEETVPMRQVNAPERVSFDDAVKAMVGFGNVPKPPVVNTMVRSPTRRDAKAFQFRRGDVRGNVFQLLNVAESPDYITMAGGGKDPALESMTVAQIAKKYGNKAVGKYQIQRDTAFDTLRRAGLDPETYVFNARGQDKLFDLLLEQRGKLSEYKAGKIDAKRFARNLASVWAGLPMDESGRSRYEKEGNKAHIPWQVFLQALE